MQNVLVIIVDCLRNDRVTAECMPFLYLFGGRFTRFTNYYSTSHCTDPSITHMLSGKHPDELGLYSMMYDKKDYAIPQDVEMLSQTAQKCGYTTAVISNLGRWYQRGVDRYVNCRGWPGDQIFARAKKLAGEIEEPWFMVVHTDDCHANYTGGSYNAACSAVDSYMAGMIATIGLEKTSVYITSDHGEGLGEAGPDGRAIQQHGYGLWPFMTHVPLICSSSLLIPITHDRLTDNGILYGYLRAEIDREYHPDFRSRDFVDQVGATPEVFHRGIVDRDGGQYVVAYQKDGPIDLYFLNCKSETQSSRLESAMQEWVDGIAESQDEGMVMDRLRGLGYWDG